MRAPRIDRREGSILEGVVRRLGRRPDVLLVAAAGRDHPRRAGLALHLGAVLDLPTVGVTDNPLLATGDEPGPAWMAEAPLHLGGEVVAYRRGRARARKAVVAHAAWRTHRAREHRARPLARADARGAPARARVTRYQDLAATQQDLTFVLQGEHGTRAPAKVGSLRSESDPQKGGTQKRRKRGLPGRTLLT